VNIGIIGLPQTGKKTLFSLLVGKGALEHRGDATKTARGVADIVDPRFDSLLKIYSPRKHHRAQVEVLLPQKIEEQSVSKGGIFQNLAEVDVFCHVVRGFQNPSVYHIWGTVDPFRDIDYVNTEFVLHDLIFVEKRFERIDKDLKKVKDEHAVKERELLARFRTHLEDEHPLRTMGVTPEERKLIASYPLLSAREMIVVLNVADTDVGNVARVDEITTRYSAWRTSCVQIAVEIEAEIAALESAEERRTFMAEMGLEHTALHVLTRQCIDALGLVSFFTVASDELRQWFVRKGATAVEAAGKIHTDMARGFIRTEVIKFDDLVSLGSEEKVKNAGKLAVRGRDYVVEDGDILFVRFSV
jgi:GTP-binding protein YchF